MEAMGSPLAMECVLPAQDLFWVGILAVRHWSSQGSSGVGELQTISVKVPLRGQLVYYAEYLEST